MQSGQIHIPSRNSSLEWVTLAGNLNSKQLCIKTLLTTDHFHITALHCFWLLYLMCNYYYISLSIADDDSRGPLILHDLVVVESIIITPHSTVTEPFQKQSWNNVVIIVESSHTNKTCMEDCRAC